MTLQTPLVETNLNTQELECLLGVDPQKTFEDKVLGELPVENAIEIVPVINAEIERVQQAAGVIIFSGDAHEIGHFSLASSYEGISPFTLLTLEMIDTIQLSPQAKFTKEELKIALEKGPQMAWPDHGVAGTKGAEYIDGINTNRVDYNIIKGLTPSEECYSAFGGIERKTKEPLLDLLKRLGVTTITIVGLALDYCVKASTIDAVKNGFNVILKVSGTKAVDPSKEIEVLEELRKLGVKIVD